MLELSQQQEQGKRNFETCLLEAVECGRRFRFMAERRLEGWGESDIGAKFSEQSPWFRGRILALWQFSEKHPVRRM
jgi:hypothetical protein